VNDRLRPPRAGAELVCTLERRGRFLVASPAFGRSELDRRHGGARLQLSIGPARALHGRELGVGDLVLVRVQRAGRAQIVERVGRPEHPAEAIRALALEAGLGRGFERAAQDEAEALRRRASSLVAEGGRVDLRDLPTFTIDPRDARDFDDAISARELAGGAVLLWVHIADVAAFVCPGGAIDRCARERACSVYLPGAVEPMLPEALSGDLCSLRAGVDRAALSVELEIDDGLVQRVAFRRSLIRSDARLEYEQVDRMLSGKERPSGEIGPSLAAAHRVACALARRREQAGALALESFEPEVRIDPDGGVQIAMRRSGGAIAGASDRVDARGMIEQLMIAANEAVAAHLRRARMGTLYRVHEHPEPARVELLRDQLASLNLPTPPLPEVMVPAEAARALAQIATLTAKHLRAQAARAGARGDCAAQRSSAALQQALGSLIVRSLPQAFYSPRNIGHAALCSDAYCHFTSPIRRYPDLVCHRALLASMGAARPPSSSDLAELGALCSEAERSAMAIEREADALARCFALQQALARGERERALAGTVVAVIGAGAFIAFGVEEEGRLVGAVEVGPPPFEGFLAVPHLRAVLPGAAAPAQQQGTSRAPRVGEGRSAGGRRDFFESNQERTILRAQGSGAALRIGDRLAVRVGRIETLRGRIELLPAQPSGAVRHRPSPAMRAAARNGGAGGKRSVPRGKARARKRR
jgi:ribonuclease R